MIHCLNSFLWTSEFQQGIVLAFGVYLTISRDILGILSGAGVGTPDTEGAEVRDASKLTSYRVQTTPLLTPQQGMIWTQTSVMPE